MPQEVVALFFQTIFLRSSLEFIVPSTRKKTDFVSPFSAPVHLSDLQEIPHFDKAFGTKGVMDEWPSLCGTPETSGKVLG